MRFISDRSLTNWINSCLTLLLAVQFAACFRITDVEKIECKKEGDCPNNYVCLMEGNAVSGKCVKNTNAGASKDGSTLNEKGSLDVAYTSEKGTPSSSPADANDAPQLPINGDPGIDNTKDPSVGIPEKNEKRAEGACTSGTQCQSGFCVNGVCCDTACDGVCSACTLVLTGKPDGTCAFVGDGKKDPKNTCVDETAKNQCGSDGLCDGVGACRKVSATHVCQAATCSGSTFTPAATCDGKGACKTVTPVPCGVAACDVTDGCLTSCEKDVDCSSTSYCNSTTKHCAAKKIDGETCDLTNECSSGHCVDGVCCNSACTGKCMACANSLTGQKSGVCSAATVGTNPHDSCTVDAANECGTDGKCDGAGACRMKGTDVVCKPAVCAEDSFTRAATCDGKGKCSTPTAESCGGFVCTIATGCQKSCKADSDCTGQNFCDSKTKTCTSKKDKGSACIEAKECTSGFCVDGFCCSGACTDACTSCKNAETSAGNGNCASVIAGKPDPKKICTDEQAANSCGNTGLCGSGGACQKADKTKVCGAAVCEGSLYTPASTCDGSGKCEAKDKIDCKNILCSLDGCLKSCKDNSDCSSKTYCDTTKGNCVAKLNQGDACGTDGTKCTSGKCVEGVCCDSACTESCKSCKVAGNVGKCTAVKASDPDPKGICKNTNTICGTNGKCDGNGGCDKGDVGVVCDESCTSSLFTKKTCDTNGECKGNSIKCEFGCDGKTCASGLDLGASCGTDGNKCTSKFCVDGKCCNSACNQTCQSCATGTCTNVTTPRTGMSCSGTDTTCKGYCDGKKPSCYYPPRGELCVKASCTNGKETTEGVCDGLGACTGSTSKLCAPYTCDGNQCASGCPINKKLCDGICIDKSICCGGCSGTKPVCGSDGNCAACPVATPNWCSGSCVNFSTDKNNCGGCGKSCGGDQKCTGGNCECPAGQDTCGGTSCVALDTTSNCGSCGKKCASGQKCTGGNCECPAGQDTCGGTSCIPLTTNAHCGTCLNSCTGTNSPYCLSSVCVQCLNDNHCNSLDWYCDSRHYCQCRPANTSNVVKNPGMDYGLSNWDISGAVYDSSDAIGCPGSGAIKLTGNYSDFSQCIPVPTAKYNWGLSYKKNAGNVLECSFALTVDSYCAMDNPYISYETWTSSSASTSGWANTPTGTLNPPSVPDGYSLYAYIRCTSSGGDAWFDRIFLNSSVNHF